MLNKNLNGFQLVMLVLALILNSLFPTVTLASDDLTQQQICEGNGINYQEATQLAKRIKTAVEKKNKKALANMMQYPLKVYTRKLVEEKTIKSRKEPIIQSTLKHGSMIIRSKQQFIKDYHKIIISELSARLEKYPADIFCNYHGGMAYSAFWFEGFFHKPLKVFSINQPTTH